MKRSDKNKMWIMILLCVSYFVYIRFFCNTCYRASDSKFRAMLFFAIGTPALIYQEIKDYLNKKRRKDDENDKKDDANDDENDKTK